MPQVVWGIFHLAIKTFVLLGVEAIALRKAHQKIYLYNDKVKLLVEIVKNNF
jgi:hypothetical protein